MKKTLFYFSRQIQDIIFLILTRKIMKVLHPIPKFFLSLVITIIIVYGCAETKNDCLKKPNPYVLEIIQCPSDYRKLIANDPDMELIDLAKFIPTVVLDIRYATANNFTGKVIYTKPKAYVRKPVALALKNVQDSLSKLGLALKIYDAYRPYSATIKFYEVYPDTNFVANPKNGSRHNRGAAVDLTLVNITTGQELPMPTPYDDFSEKAHPDYPHFPEEILQNRALLFGVLSYYGFIHYPTEWWHFDFRGWQQFPLMDLSFEELE